MKAYFKAVLTIILVLRFKVKSVEAWVAILLCLSTTWRLQTNFTSCNTLIKPDHNRKPFQNKIALATFQNTEFKNKQESTIR